MLKCQDVVFVSGKDKEILSKNYDKVYFSHTAGDKVETSPKQFAGKPDAGSAVSPVGKTSASLDQLYNEMVDYIGANFAGDPKNPTPPQSTIIQLVEKGLDLTTRANVGAALRPKDFDAEKTLASMAKNFVMLGVYPTIETAMDALRAQREAALAKAAA